MHSLDTYAADKIQRLEAASLLRRLKPTQRTAGAVVERDGRGCCRSRATTIWACRSTRRSRPPPRPASNYGAGAAPRGW
jgi:hypothetical protein